ncbi:3-isopropylmalate dehydratase small subunit [Methanobrevibacter arboriphilus]|jgi:methanogen homoaconitase small subunit|uniref:3-isopropylmalate dehydratase small subunit n=1 Tax=Methanobrevibacter arboriphilus TaxID=39441 RepID=A0ACA8R5D4_METAZ|nr:homoaconitase small subunit [Methanobrevibacter arboriphilus]BBL62840.1 3-isopropylmalate dehydratase small subunit [Methanobrevibacter arboriphilus]GLI12574.1 3-isopropylmalate dehydratase small subunit [Methanobrevibacter arboriphilus]
MDKIKGKVWKFGDNIDTDVIIPGRYLRTFNPEDLARHVMAGEREDFASVVESGDIILADDNFGCGSSREQAPVAIKTAGVSAVIAKSFARIFYRNAINIGLPVVKADIDAKEGDIISLDLKKGVIINESSGKSFKIEPFKDFMLDILSDGGLVKHYLNEK